MIEIRIAKYLVLIVIVIGCQSTVYATSELSNKKDISPEQNPIYPHTNKHLSLSECFDKANYNNKEIALAASNLNYSESAIVIAKAIPNPTYNLTYGWGPAWRFVIAGNNQQFGWNEEIQVAGKRTKKTNVAKADYLEKIFELEATRFDIHNRVRRAYAELTVAAAYDRLIRSQLGIAQKLLDIAQKRYETGKAPGSEVLQAKLNLMQFNIQKNQATSRLVQASAQLSFLLGDTPHNQEIIDTEENGLFRLSTDRSGLVPDTSRPLPPLDAILPLAWRQRNDLKAAIQQAYTDRRALTLAKAKRIPNPFVGFSYLFSTYQPFQTQYYTPQPNAIKVPFQPGYLLSVVHETPIFNQYQGEINQAKALWNQQLKKNEQLIAQIATDTVSAYETVKTNRENINKYIHELLPSAMQSAQISRRGYELGKTDLATAILSQQQFGQLLSSYFDSVVLYQNNWADLEKAVGIPLNL